MILICCQSSASPSAADSPPIDPFRLLLQFIQQWDDHTCSWPYHVCFTFCGVDGSTMDIHDPHLITIPKEGLLRLNFVDLRPIPPGARYAPRKQQQDSNPAAPFSPVTLVTPMRACVSSGF